MKKKQLTIAVSLIVGAITLSTAVLANYGNANGYTVYKNGLKKLIKEQNYTMKMTGKLSFDDQILQQYTTEELFSKTGDANLNRVSTIYSPLDEEQEYKSGTYFQDGHSIRMNTVSFDKNGNFISGANPNYYVNDDYTSEYVDNTLGMGFSSNESEQSIDKKIHFAELVGDMFVGDLKNNFVLVSSENGLSNYAVTLDSFQIPEIANAGLDMIFSSIAESYKSVSVDDMDTMDKYFLQLGSNPVVESASCAVIVDEDGRIVENTVSAALAGKDANGASHKLSLDFTLNMSDYGTTVPEKLDFDTLPNVTFASKENEERRNELEKLLQDDSLSDDKREQYEAELNHLTKRANRTASIQITSPETAALIEN